MKNIFRFRAMVLVAILSTVMGLGLFAPMEASAKDDCKDLQAVFVRGSGQKQNDSDE